MIKEEKKNLEPVTYFTTNMLNYSPKAVEELQADIWMDLARDNHGIIKPHCSILFYVIPIDLLFEATARQHGYWELKVNIFDTDKQLEEWVNEYGPDKVLELCYNRV